MNFGEKIDLFDYCFENGPLANISTELYLNVNNPLQSQIIDIVSLQVCCIIVLGKDIYYGKSGGIY